MKQGSVCLASSVSAVIIEIRGIENTKESSEKKMNVLACYQPCGFINKPVMLKLRWFAQHTIIHRVNCESLFTKKSCVLLNVQSIINSKAISLNGNFKNWML